MGEGSRDRALEEVVGALAYALLRVFQITAAATVAAPTIALRERQAAFAVEEFDRYRVLRKRLAALGGDVEAAMERFRAPLDSFYEAVPAGGWLDAQVFHFVGETITADFAEILATHVDDKTAAAVREALAGRAAHTAFALEQINEAVDRGGSEAEDRVRELAGRIVGDAMNRMREALLESDALALVIGGDVAMKELVLEILGRHRERLERLGIDRLD